MKEQTGTKIRSRKETQSKVQQMKQESFIAQKHECHGEQDQQYMRLAV